MMENYWDREEAAVGAGADPAADARRRDPLAQHLRPRDSRRRSQRASWRARRGVLRPVFNGHDFAGWAGPLDNYEIVDGAIRCKPKKGGTIFTKEEYADFVVRLEFKLPPGGNNGLAIRYPGEATPPTSA